MLIEGSEENEREDLRRMLTTYSSNVPVNTDAPEWTPPGWGTDEENAAEAAKFNTFTRNLRPVL